MIKKKKGTVSVMRKIIKMIMLSLAVISVMGAVAIAAPATTASWDDPAKSYVKEIAPYEDSSLNLWFEHSFKKVLTEDKSPSGMDTYSAYMAKNEIENIQFVLYSDTKRAGMSATVSEFKDSNGNIIPAEIYYQMYITISDISDEFVYTANSETTPIREGETPDPIYPLKKIGGKFQLNAGKSQAFYIRVKTDANTPAGWYSASLDIKNSAGETVKTATVYCYVWDFELSEETAFETALYLGNDTTYGGSYQKFYDYLLENRLVAMDIPGGLTSDNPYLTNPRVNAVRVTYGGGGANNSYGEIGTNVEYINYLDVYNELSTSDVWDSVKDKFYFYTADEPVGAVWNKLTGSKNATVDDVKTFYSHLSDYWESPMTTVPYHENHPYPYFHYTNAMSTYKDYQLMDATQAMLEQGGVSIWCPQIYAFTPQYELTAAGYKGMNGEPVRELSATISNLYTYGANNSASGTVGVDLFYGVGYYNWNNLFGEFSDRIYSAMAVAKEKGETANSRLWTYGAGANYCYTYANHLIENTGLQTKMMFWQCYQNDITGYLNYSVNGWSEVDDQYGTNTFDNTTTGSFTMCEWRTNKYTYNGSTFYGNGVLFYGASQAKMRGVSDYVGTVRIELMRDGVEEYQMLTMLEEYLGEKAAKDVVSRVSTNLVRYLSLPGFNRSAFDSSMDEYDIMNAVRMDLGNALEAAVLSEKCDHDWDSGKVTKNAECLTVGTVVYSCKNCDAEYDEYIPALHTKGDCFTKVSGDAPTCTTDGEEIFACDLCGYKKTVKTTAFHDNEDYYRFEEYSDAAHSVYCTACDERIGAQKHMVFLKDTATCTEDGFSTDWCQYCGYETLTKDDAGNELRIPVSAKGHKFENGACSVCGEADPDSVVEPEYTPGDINGDGAVNSMDANLMKRILAGILTPTEEQILAGDFDNNGVINGMDSNVLVRVIAGTN